MPTLVECLRWMPFANVYHVLGSLQAFFPTLSTTLWVRYYYLPARGEGTGARRGKNHFPGVMYKWIRATCLHSATYLSNRSHTGLLPSFLPCSFIHRCAWAHTHTHTYPHTHTHTTHTPIHTQSHSEACVTQSTCLPSLNAKQFPSVAPNSLKHSRHGCY